MKVVKVHRPVRDMTVNTAENKLKGRLGQFGKLHILPAILDTHEKINK